MSGRVSNWVEQLTHEVEGFVGMIKMACGWRPRGPEDIPEEFWGECPYCGKSDRYLNIGTAHWFVCHRHRVKWYGGQNVFNTWRHQTIEDWRANARLLSYYVETDDPVFRDVRTRCCVRDGHDTPNHIIQAHTFLLEEPRDERRSISTARNRTDSDKEDL